MGLRKKKPVKRSDVKAESGVMVAVGDDIVIDSGSTLPFVARVQSVLPAAKKKENGRLKVSWYYFPEDTTGGRQVFHSKCEIFKSNHDDIISTQSVMNVCKVLQLPQWCTYHAEGDSQRQGHKGPHSTRPFNKPQEAAAAVGQPTANNTTEADQNAKPPVTDAADAAPQTDKDAPAAPKPAAPKPAAPKSAPDRETPAKAKSTPGAAAKGNGSDLRGKRKLPEQGGEPSPTARKAVHEPSPEPAPPAAEAAPPAKNGSAAASGAGKKGGEGAGEGSADRSDREASPMVFLCRHAYDAKRHKWVDEEVPLYCVCCMPYNPDLDMVECARCGEWFHGECLGMNAEQFDIACKQEEWTCIACSAKNTKSRAE